MYVLASITIFICFCGWKKYWCMQVLICHCIIAICISTSLVKYISTFVTQTCTAKTLIGYFILLPRHALPYFKLRRSLMYRILAYPFILRKWLLRGFMWLDTRLMCLKTSNLCCLFCMQQFIQVWINSLFTKVIIMRSRCQD